MRRFLSALLSVLILPCLAPAVLADEPPPSRTLVVGTGEVTGFHFPAGGAVCRMLNRERARHGLRCLVEPSAGSIANIAALRTGEADLALVQSRLHQMAWDGKENFAADGPFKDMRALFSLHPEALAVLARKDARIRQIDDLKGKKVNLGRPGSFQRGMAEAVLAGMGWSEKDFGAVLEVEPGQQGKAVCEGKADAAFVTAVHPSAEIRRALSECGAVLVPLEDSRLDALVGKTPWLARAVIPAGTYGLKKEIPTFGTKATLVTTTRLSEADAYTLVREVFENFEDFQARFPVLETLSREEMVMEGLAAPLHDGALRYYREAGLIKP